MNEKTQIHEIKKFIEEQIWYIQTTAKDMNINLEIVRNMSNTKDRMNARLWTMVDILEMIKELESQEKGEQASTSQT